MWRGDGEMEILCCITTDWFNCSERVLSLIIGSRGSYTWEIREKMATTSLFLRNSSNNTVIFLLLNLVT